MRKFVSIVTLFVMFGCVPTTNLGKLNKSMKNLISKSSSFRNYSNYVLKNRNSAFEILNLNIDSLNKEQSIAIIEEYDPLLSHRIVTEIFFFGNKTPIKYIKMNENSVVTKTEKTISGRTEIIKYIEKDDLNGLKNMTVEKSKSISDGSWIFVSTFKNNVANSVLISQFSIN